MGYVFISCWSGDRALAHDLIAHLTRRGVDVWNAAESIPTGADYGEAIAKAIIDCDCYALMLTEGSQQSKMVRAELMLACKREKKRIVFNFVGPEIDDRIGFFINTIQSIKVIRDSDNRIIETAEFQAGVEAIAEICGAACPSRRDDGAPVDR